MLDSSSTLRQQVVNVRSDPPVVKFAVVKTAATLLQEEKERQKAAKLKAKTSSVKEMHLRAKIDPHDMNIKLKKVRELLSK